jgi:hypothetical protein
MHCRVLPLRHEGGLFTGIEADTLLFLLMCLVCLFATGQAAFSGVFPCA